MTNKEQFEAYWARLNDVKCYGEECHTRIAETAWQARGELDAKRIAELEAKLAIAIEALEKVISTGLDSYTYNRMMSESNHYLNEALTKIKGE